MKWSKIYNIDTTQEIKPVTVIDLFSPASEIRLFRPTIEMAAELMNVSASVVEEWLSRVCFSMDAQGRLSEIGIDFLAKKYINNLHKYFDNAMLSWDNMESEERDLFVQFKAKYGKIFRFHVEKWKDIDVNRIEKDFRKELDDKAFDALYYELGFIDTRKYQTISAQEIYALRDSLDAFTRSERVPLLYLLSHSLYYATRINTRIPIRPECRDIILEILQENRFHIFSGESDSNVLIDAFLSSKVKQPQLAIASVFGYTRHKNNRFNETHYQNQTYSCS